MQSVEDGPQVAGDILSSLIICYLAPKVPDWKHIVDLNSIDFGLLDDFLTQGQMLLHYSSMSDNPIVSELLPRCHSSAAVMTAVIAFQACQSEGIEGLARFDKAMMLYRQKFLTEDVSCMLFTGMMICHASMHLGYGWTEQIAGLLSLARSCGYVKSNERVAIQVVEALGVMDLDVWLIARRTNPNHIWSKYCLGRSGVEPITGLPRSLLDLIAIAVSNQGDNVEDIRTWAAELDPKAISPAQYHIWNASALATILYMHIRGAAVSDYKDLASMVRAHIDHFLESISWQNPRQAIWPLYTVGQLATDTQMRRHDIHVLHEKIPLLNQTRRNPIKLLLEELWARNDAGESVTADVVIGEKRIELGVW